VTDRIEAEAIATGDPLSGPDKLIDRIEDGLSDAYDEGYEVGEKCGLFDALSNLACELDIDGEVPEGHDDALKWLVKAIGIKCQEEQYEAYNEALDDLSDALDTQRAMKIAKSMYRGLNNKE
jgi:hypothetical protein